MAITIVPGDLLVALRNGEVNVIGHCANMQNRFKSGIAKDIREQFPGAYRADTEWFRTHDVHRRPYSIGSTGLEDGTIFNLYGQVSDERTPRDLHYGLLAKALNQMASLCIASDIVGFPYLIGCNLAGGDWEVVQELIEGAFSHCEVRIYKLDKPI